MHSPLLHVIAFALSLCAIPGLHAGTGRMEPFDDGWLFLRGDCVGGELVEQDDSAWRKVDLPHDWSIEDAPKPENPEPGRVVSGPFDSEAAGGVNTGYTVGGTGWYRKHFATPEDLGDRLVMVVFDGVFMDADVWINGHHLGNHPYGYTPFAYDLTDHLVKSGDNVLAVRAKNEGFNTRWYSGSGIYRHVKLDVADRVRVAPWGIYVTTPEAAEDSAVVRVVSTLENVTGERQTVGFVTKLFDPAGAEIASRSVNTRMAVGVPSDITQQFAVENPSLWSPDSPSLYTVQTQIVRDGKTVDVRRRQFGIRSIRFDADKGFFLNGKSVKLMGGSVHADNGPLGAMSFDAAEARKVKCMKDVGFNVTRTAHNPPSEAFLDACDRLGLLVIDEAFDSWVLPHVDGIEDYHVFFGRCWKDDLGAMIRRDRSHPSVIMWGIGNQIRNSASDEGARIARELTAFAHSLDDSRPVMSNVFRWWEDKWEDMDPFFVALDVCGYSYARAHYDEDHKRVPDRIIFSSEIDPAKCFDNYMDAMDRDFVCGNIEWTAVDYIGESGLGWLGPYRDFKKTFPWHVSYCGDIDICGWRVPRSYYKEVMTSRSAEVFAFAVRPVPAFPGRNPSKWGWSDVTESWSWAGFEGREIQVDVYSSCDEVRLLLNGRDLGSKKTDRSTKFMASWQVPYEEGVLSAVGFVKGREIARCERKSAGKPAAVRLLPESSGLVPDGQDLCYVTAELVDTEGTRVPCDDRLLHFTLEGDGSILSVANANPVSLESFQQSERKTYEGRCLVVLRAGHTGRATILKVSTDGLPDGVLRLE